MPKTNRKPGIHLHKTTKYKIKDSKGTGIPGKVADHHEFFWILIAKNGKTIARSSETYKTRRAAVASIQVASDIIRFVAPSSFYDHTKKETEQVVY
jgi:uncharacterized protein YegP (UPF0339 family)